MAPEKKSLGDKITDVFRNVFEPIADLLLTPVKLAIEWGIEAIFDAIGKGLAGKQTKLFDKILKEEELPEESKEIIEAAKEGGGEWQGLLAYSTAGTAIGATTGSFFSVLLRSFTQVLNRKFPNEIPDVSTIMSAWRRLGEEKVDLVHYLKSIGFDEGRMEWFKAVTEILLPVDALRELLLRGEITEADLKEELQKQGWTAERIDQAMKLFWVIPPLADMTTMAMRLAFSPESRTYWPWAFEAPADFVNAAAKIGLSKEWCEYYWFIHWVQPSPGQQFEMFHRGIINEEDVRRALWALGYSDWWIGRFIEMAYRVYTRVDVRRMYRVGVLDRAGVKRAYLDLGYNEERAENMTEFTILYETESDRDLTKSDVLDGYRRGIMDRAGAEELLGDLGYSADEADFYLNREDLKKSLGYSDDLVETYRKQYLGAMITQEEARSKLAGIGVEAGRITELLALWREQKATKEFSPELLSDRDLTRTDVLDGYKKGLLTREETDSYLGILGYDPAERGFLLEKADYDKQKEVKDLSLTTYRNLYTLGIIDKTTTTAALVAQGFAKEELEWLYTLWDIQRVGTVTLPTRADLTRFLKKGIISKETYVAEMQRRGYTDTYITWYLEDMEE